MAQVSLLRSGVYIRWRAELSSTSTMSSTACVRCTSGRHSRCASGPSVGGGAYGGSYSPMTVAYNAPGANVASESSSESGSGRDAPNNIACGSNTLAGAGTSAQQQIATAQGYIAAGKAAVSGLPGGAITQFFGGMAGYFFAVHTGGPNDIKNQPGSGQHNRLGVDAGNLSYGITCPYGAGFCQFAAGLAQTLGGHPDPNGPLSTGFDTPSDNLWIRYGQAMRKGGCHE